MRRPHGYWQCVDPDPARTQPGLVERDTVNCSHCSRNIRVKPGTDGTEQAPKCSKCDEHICPECKRRGGCWPIEMACEIVEAPRQRLDRAIRADQDRALFLRDVFGVKL